MVDTCGLNKEVHAKYWLVQLAIATKKSVHRWIRDFAFELNGMPTSMHLNVLFHWDHIVCFWVWIGCTST